MSNSAFAGAPTSAAFPWPSAVVESLAPGGGLALAVGLGEADDDGLAEGLGDALAPVADADELSLGLAGSRRDRAVRLWPPEPAPAGPSAAPDVLGDGLAVADVRGEADGVGVGTGAAVL